LIAGESLVVTGPGAIGLMGVAVGKALGAQPVILTGTRDLRLKLGKQLGADHLVNIKAENPVEAVKRITGGKGVHYVLECSGSPDGLSDGMDMVMRGGRICLIGFANQPVTVDVAKLVRNHIAVFGIRGEGRSATHRVAAQFAQRRYDAKLIHTHTFPMEEVPKAFTYSRDRIDGAIKVVVKIHNS
jgi:L-iditol 2-dehydrogenase